MAPTLSGTRASIWLEGECSASRRAGSQPTVASALGAFDLNRIVRVVGQRVVGAHQGCRPAGLRISVLDGGDWLEPGDDTVYAH